MLVIDPDVRQWIDAQSTVDSCFLKLLESVEQVSDCYCSVQLLIYKDHLAVKLPDAIAKKPFNVDFSQYLHRMHRIQHRQWQGEYLLQLLGKQKCFNIIDATAGFGRDSFLLAAAGHQVAAHEANPLVALLLYAGLKKTYEDERINVACKRINLKPCFAQSIDAVVEANDATVCYLDPMFQSEKAVSLKNEKFAQVLQALTINFFSTKTELNALLEWAFSLGFMTVVVKQSPQSIENVKKTLNQLNKNYFLRQTKQGKGFTLSAFSLI